MQHLRQSPNLHRDPPCTVSIVLVDECLTHPGGVFLIDAKHDRLLEAVAAFLQELGDLLRDELGDGPS